MATEHEHTHAHEARSRFHRLRSIHKALGEDSFAEDRHGAQALTHDALASHLEDAVAGRCGQMLVAVAELDTKLDAVQLRLERESASTKAALDRYRAALDDPAVANEHFGGPDGMGFDELEAQVRALHRRWWLMERLRLDGAAREE